jgi:hypothetical protein
LFRSNNLETLVDAYYVPITFLRCIFDVVNFSSLAGGAVISESCSVGLPLNLSIYRIYCPIPTSIFTPFARIAPERRRILRFGLFCFIQGTRTAW